MAQCRKHCHNVAQVASVESSRFGLWKLGPEKSFQVVVILTLPLRVEQGSTVMSASRRGPVESAGYHVFPYHFFRQSSWKLLLRESSTVP